MLMDLTMYQCAVVMPIDPWWAAFLVGWVTASVIIGGGAFILRWRQLSLAARGAEHLPVEAAVTPIEEAPVTDEPVDALPEPEAPSVEGPGPLFQRFKALQAEFELAVKEMQRLNGTREAQLQGYQILSTDIVRRVLPVLENLQPYLDDEDSALADVAQMASGRLMTELVTVGVTRFVPEIGEPFDARSHLLLARDDGAPPYRVRTVVAPGYRFRPRVPGANEVMLKPAEVTVEGTVEEITAPAEAIETENTARVSEQV